MKKSLAILLIPALMVGTKVFADQASTATAVSTPSNSSSASTKTKSSKKKKKAAAQSAPVAATPAPTAVASPSTMSTSKKTVSNTSSLFSNNMDLYDRLGAPGDLRQAISLAATNYGSSASHDRSVFLWLGKVTGGDAGKSAFVRFNIDSIELGGAKKPWILLTGVVSEQSGSDCKTGDTIEVGVDFRDVKVDYEGTKLGEVQKGNDIADQVHEILTTQSAYQWVVLADSQLKSQSMSDRPAFIVKAKDGYSLLETLESRR